MNIEIKSDEKIIVIDSQIELDLHKNTLTIFNAGLPGVIGPHLEFSISELIKNEHESAIKYSESENWCRETKIK